MSEELTALKDRAEKGRVLYNAGHIDRADAKKYIMPYIDAFNAKSTAIAKKYGMRPKLITFNTFVR